VHPAISATAKALRKAKPGPDEVVRASGHGCCGIEVGAASLERTIAVLDSIARALDARGLKVEPIDNSMRVALPPDSLTFALAERIEKRNHVPTMEELAKEEQLRKKQERKARLGIWSFNRERAYPEFDFMRTGELAIQIADQYVRGLRPVGMMGSGRKSRVSSTISLAEYSPIWQESKLDAKNENASSAIGTGGKD